MGIRRGDAPRGRGHGRRIGREAPEGLPAVDAGRSDAAAVGTGPRGVAAVDAGASDGPAGDTGDSPAAPRRSARREATRQRLLDAAAEAFAERGFYGTSVEELCERAGFTRGAFYSNFSSRDEVFLELYARHGAQLTAAITALADEDLSPVALLLAAIDAWESGGTARLSWHLLISEFSLHALRDPEVGRAYAASQAELRTQLAGAIDARLARAGLTLAEPTDQVVRLCLAVMLGSTSQHLLEPQEQPRGQLERTFLPRLVESLLRPADD